MSPNRYDGKLKEIKREKKLNVRVRAEAERLRFEAKNKGQPPKLRITFPAWLNALEDPPFDKGKLTWGLNIMFPFKVPKSKCEKFKELIQDAFQKIFLD